MRFVFLDLVSSYSRSHKFLPRRAYRLVSLILLIILLLTSSLFAVDREYRIKAEFLERFTRFIDWPVEYDQRPADMSFQICVLGQNPYGEYLSDFSEKIKIHGRRVTVGYITKIDQAADCQLLFISVSEHSRLASILSFTKDKPILTVADTPGFGAHGVHINFFTEEDFIRFEINLAAARSSGLRFSSRLLKLGRLIQNENALSEEAFDKK